MAILYAEDWDEYPTAIADIHSRNTSWVIQAVKYRDMGIKNWDFCLALLNPQLQGVDPFDPYLPSEYRSLIILECWANPWYFLREIQRVPAKAGGAAGLLKANRGNIAMFWCVFNSFITYVQQVRQTGKSLNTRALVNYFHHCGAEQSEHVLFTKGDLRAQEIKAYKEMRSLLPPYLCEISPKEADNQIGFTTKTRSNETFSYIPQGDPVSANKVGRGRSPALITGDEIPFLDYVDISLASLAAATTAVFDEARLKGAMHGILYTTTAGDLSTSSGKYVYEKIKKAGMFFSEILFDCKNRADALAVIGANAGVKGSKYVDISFNHRQLGYSDEWLRDKIATVPGTKSSHQRDFLSQWTYGSSRNPIDENLLRLIQQHRAENVEMVRSKYNFLIRHLIPIEEFKQRQMVLGMDTSNAVGRDAITGIFTDIETGESCAAFTVNESNTNLFARWLLDLMIQYPNFVVIGEDKSSWQGILDWLMVEGPLHGIDVGRRLYSRIVDTAMGDDAQRKAYQAFCAGSPTERKYAQFRNKFGFPTNATLRDDLYNNIMETALKQLARLIRDPVLIEELSSLVEKNNRIDHSASGHDDHVIAWLLTQWFLRKARNLDHYGIDQRRVLSKVKIAGVGPDKKAIVKELKQDKLAMQIEELERQLENAKTIIEHKYLQARLDSLKCDVTRTDEEGDNGSIDRHSAIAANKKTLENKTKHQGGLFRKGLGGLFRR